VQELIHPPGPVGTDLVDLAVSRLHPGLETSETLRRVPIIPAQGEVGQRVTPSDTACPQALEDS